MNTLKGKISSIETNENLSLVKVEVGQYTLSSIVIDSPKSAPYLTEGHAIKVLFKETEVSIGLDQEYAISLQNQLRGTVQTVNEGILLSRVVIQIDTTSITAVITTHAVKQLHLKPGLPVKALIKTNEIMLSE